MVETTYHIPGAPNLALLSDFHNTDPAPILSSLSLRRPELICVCGDIVYGSRPEGDASPLHVQKNVLPFLSSCAAIAPTFLSLGNHEWMLDDEDIREIEKTGVTVLDNSWVEKDGVIIGGLTSGYVTDYRRFRDSAGRERYPRKDNTSTSDHKPDTAWLDSYSSVPGYHLLLSHHPEIWPEIKSKNIELVLSGHAHGGQWRIFNRGVWSPGQGFWPRWTRGVYDGRLVVSAGLSNTTWVPRLFNPTEVVYIVGDCPPLIHAQAYRSTMLNCKLKIERVQSKIRTLLGVADGTTFIWHPPKIHCHQAPIARTQNSYYSSV